MSNRSRDGIVTIESHLESKDPLDNTWISATQIHNYIMKDPLLDWLKLYYSQFSSSHSHYTYTQNSLSKSEYNFTSYIMEQGCIFEKKILKLLTKKFGSHRIASIKGETNPRDINKVKDTLKAMKKGYPIIHSGVLHNPKNKTFGIPDLLVRSDWFNYLIDQSPLTESMINISAKKLKTNYHYRVIDIKFTSLLLRADGLHLLNSGFFPAYKSQLLIYNQALSELQGYTPNQVYILGRQWKYTSKGESHNNNACFDKLGIIDYSGIDLEYINLTEKALSWIRDVRSPSAKNWNILKYPLHRWELYPNMCNGHDYPWHGVKEQIAKETKELTSLWMVGPKNRALALQNDICQWVDKSCTPSSLGIKGEKLSPVLSAIININRDEKDIKILPKYIKNNLNNWKHQDKIEFFVDFETCNGAVSSIKKLPAAKTGTLVFMIGVGYITPDTKIWEMQDFTVDRLTFDEEAKICKEFSTFILETSKKYGVKQPRCIHWARAEDIMWTEAVDRHDPISDQWKSWKWDWLDLLAVFKAEPIVIESCMSFGLKDVAKAMKKHGFIETAWDKDSDCIDGQSAMVAACKAHNQARKYGISMRQIDVMKQIVKYNEVDVRVLYEIITYLRTNHIQDIKRISSKRRHINNIPNSSNSKKSQKISHDLENNFKTISKPKYQPKNNPLANNSSSNDSSENDSSENNFSSENNSSSKDSSENSSSENSLSKKDIKNKVSIKTRSNRTIRRPSRYI